RADRHGLAAPLFSKRGARFIQRGIVIGELDCRRHPMVAERHRTVRWHPRPHEGAEAVADLLRVLVADETERYLGGRLAGDHGLRALAGIAADDAVDLGGRTRRDLLD